MGSVLLWWTSAYAAGIALARGFGFPAEAALVVGSLALALWLVPTGGQRVDPAPRARPGRGAAPARQALLLLAVGCGGALAGRFALEAAQRGVPAQPLELRVEARVARVERGASEWQVELADAVDLDGARPLPRRLFVRGESTPKDWIAFERHAVGSRVIAALRIAAPQPRRNPGSSSPPVEARIQARLQHPGLHLRIEPAPRSLSERFLDRLGDYRAESGERLQHRGRGGGLLAALALGQRGGLDLALREAMAVLGLTHLLSVSGLHLALVAGAVYAALQGLFARIEALAARFDTRVPALVLALVCAWIYGLVAGWEEPAQRSAILLAALVLAFAFGRSRRAAPALALAALFVLLREPLALFAIGAQLSFAATAALMLGREVRPGASRLAQALSASALALCATAPIVAWRLGSGAPLALFANLLAIPWTGLLLMPAAALALAAVSLPLPGAEFLLGACCAVAEHSLAALDFAARHAPGGSGLGAPPFGLLLPSAGLVAVCWFTQRAGLRCASALALCALLQWRPAADLPEGVRAVFLDVGQGDATLVQGRGAALLVDAGGAAPGRFDSGASVVVPALRALGVARLDALLVTHLDVDHAGGAPAVLSALPVDEVWLPHGATRLDAAAGIRAAALRRGAVLREVGLGAPPRRLGDLDVEFLWPPPGSTAPGENEGSLVARVESGGFSLLLPGDIGRASEAELLARDLLRPTRLLKLPHHGSAGSGSAAFLAALRPEAAIASAPCFGRFELPAPALRARLAAAAIPLWWTGRDGALSVSAPDFARQPHAPLAVHGMGATRVCARPDPR